MHLQLSNSSELAVTPTSQEQIWVSIMPRTKLKRYTQVYSTPDIYHRISLINMHLQLSNSSELAQTPTSQQIRVSIMPRTKALLWKVG
jgi:hypothetical protein